MCPSPSRPGSELRYGFSEFAASLNEPERGVAPTDSRLRPDQRIMEEQDFNKANEEKVYYKKLLLLDHPMQQCSPQNWLSGRLRFGRN